MEADPDGLVRGSAACSLRVLDAEAKGAVSALLESLKDADEYVLLFPKGHRAGHVEGQGTLSGDAGLFVRSPADAVGPTGTVIACCRMGSHAGVALPGSHTR